MRLVEPLAGGAAMFFGTAPTHALLCHSNLDLIALYGVVRDSLPALLRHLQVIAAQHSLEHYYALTQGRRRHVAWLLARRDRCMLFVSRYDEDLKNTASDCRQCHQRGLERAVLLMRERTNPWTHFFGVDFDDPDGSILPDFFGMGFDGAGSSLLPDVTNRDLVRDFLAARGDESYGGVTTTAVHSSHGFLLERLVGAAQPVLFDTPTIYRGRWGIGQGSKLEVAQRSPTWDRHYEAFKRGEQLALPHYTPRPTDPVKQAALTDAYVRYRAGALPAEALPDLADIYPDDPQLRAEIGLDTELDTTPAEALIQACGPCHNDVLDQSISRGRFNVDLARLDQIEIALAVSRLKFAAQEPGAMPPS